jgi:nicotinate-nucleotide adenylyltransferase
VSVERSYIGLLGGSFDPIHLAHLALAQAAVHELNLTELQLIPAANPWQRTPLNASPEHRLRMIELAIEDQPKIRVNPIEIDRGGQTYTIDTVRALPTNNRYIWILGTDQLANFCTWHDWKGITQCVDLAVAIRPGTPLAPPTELITWLDAIGSRPLITLPFSPMAISASDIRARLARRESTSGLLPTRVAHYIRDHQLYL